MIDGTYQDHIGNCGQPRLRVANHQTARYFASSLEGPMSETVILDAMINRDDFAVKGPPISSAEPIRTLSVETLGPTGMLVPLLRKPDFQRETNHWTPKQVVSFLESFLENELIPSVILWQSESYVFVIDGGHRLSALRAWIEDDYGDGSVSLRYFSNDISEAQRKSAEKTRRLVDEKIGKYIIVKDALIHPEKHDTARVQRARNMATRSLSLQWVNGDAEKAETSFFKINTQGTPLDDSEELLLRNRHRSVAIAARSIVRAGTGHKYWSKFSDSIRQQIEDKAKELHCLFFNPEINRPIKTLDLPLGGAKSPLQALELLMQLVCITSAPAGVSKKNIEDFDEDADGSLTIAALEDCIRVASRIAGNMPRSLGLHPAVYFYSEKGRHIPDLLLGMLLLVRRKIQNNDRTFFEKFTISRENLEAYLVTNKSLITQALQIARSQTRYEKVADLFEFLIERLWDGNETTDQELVSVIAPQSVSKILAVTQNSTSKDFSTDAKSAIFIRQALEGCVTCAICKGYVDTGRSVSYDHITRVREGGQGNEANGQLTHPFCNSAVKN
jgi:hypothetical protein